ncbi:hypothetical protein WJU23_19375 [Prosthecobacter sp. SYSU 5D2]|uniref:hypothetical protein n=1 Tax=Prosthecobacter sp. SYSU 5D2 TaxID=3134134 RepID=UPI0031FF3305
MKPFVHISLALLVIAILTVGWWLAGESNSASRQIKALKTANKGPMEPDFCGPLRAPLPPPPIDSVFGLHLYATSAKGTVHPLPVMEIVDALPPPEGLPVKSGAVSDIPKNDTAYDDVQTVNVLLEEFRRAFGAMPTGELNDEIVRRLQGENPKGIAVLPKSHASISADGELLDRWGTPYRFHPESAWHMTVRSAGPDREMWTSDDLISDQGPMTTQL